MIVLQYTWELLIVTGVQLGWTRLGITPWSYWILFSHYILLPLHPLPLPNSVFKVLCEWMEGCDESPSDWLVNMTRVHQTWHPCVSLYLEKVAFRAQSGEALAFLVWKMENAIWAYFSCVSEYFCWVSWTPIAFHYHLTSDISHGPLSLWLAGRSDEQNILLLIFFKSRYKEKISFHFWIANHACSQD